MDTEKQPQPHAESSSTSLSDEDQEIALMAISLQKWGTSVYGKDPAEVRRLFAAHRERPSTNNLDASKAARELQEQNERCQRIREKQEADAARNGANTRRIHAERLYRESRVPARHDKNMSDLDANPEWLTARDRLASPETQQDGYLVSLLGGRGTGKTQLAVSVVFMACERLKRCRYIKALDLFRLIRGTFSPKARGESGESETDIIETLTKYDLLVIDEIHQRGETDFEQNTLINLLDKRYDACKCTILIANQDKAEFRDALGDSVVSRIHETGAAIPCDWPSYRKPGSWRGASAG